MKQSHNSLANGLEALRLRCEPFSTKWVVAAVLGLLFGLCATGTASAQNECKSTATQPTVVISTITDSVGVVHQTQCWDPINKITYFPLFASSSGTSNGLIFTSSGISSPGTVTAPACPTGQQPFIYGLLANGTYQDYASEDVGYSYPTSAGTLQFCYRTWWNDSGANNNAALNGLVGIHHVIGNGGVNYLTNDDRALVLVSGNSGTAQTFTAGNQLLGQYNEWDLQGTPTLGNYTSVGDNDLASTGRFNFTDKRTGGTAINSVWGGLQGVHALFDMDTAASGLYASGCSNAWCATGLRATFTNFLAGDFAGSEFSAIITAGNNRVTTPCTNCNFSNIEVFPPGFNTGINYTRFPGFNYGIHLWNFGTNASDFNLISEGVNSSGTAAGFWGIVGPISLGTKTHCTTSVDGSPAQACITGNLHLTGVCDNCSAEQLTVYGLTTLTGVKGLSVSQIPVTALASGDNNLITCPANSYCYVTGNMYNTTSGTLTFTQETSYDGGSTWRYNQTFGAQSVAAHTQAGAGQFAQFLTYLAAGEVFGVNTSNTGFNFYGTMYVWSNTSQLKKFSKTSGWINGDNTIFTCPTTHCIVTTPGQNNANLGMVAIVNQSGGTVTYSSNFVLNGGSPGASNQIQGTATTTANNTVQTFSMSGLMNNGDFLSVNSTSTGTQTAYGLVVEIP